MLIRVVCAGRRRPLALAAQALLAMAAAGKLRCMHALAARAACNGRSRRPAGGQPCLLVCTAVAAARLRTTDLFRACTFAAHALLQHVPPSGPGFKLKISERGYFPRIDDEELQMVLFRSQEIRWAAPTGRWPHQRSDPPIGGLKLAQLVGHAPATLPSLPGMVAPCSLPCSRYVEDGVLDAGICGRDWVRCHASSVCGGGTLATARPRMHARQVAGGSRVKAPPCRLRINGLFSTNAGCTDGPPAGTMLSCPGGGERRRRGGGVRAQVLKGNRQPGALGAGGARGVARAARRGPGGHDCGVGAGQHDAQVATLQSLWGRPRKGSTDGWMAGVQGHAPAARKRSPASGGPKASPVPPGPACRADPAAPGCPDHRFFEERGIAVRKVEYSWVRRAGPAGRGLKVETDRCNGAGASG